MSSRWPLLFVLITAACSVGSGDPQPTAPTPEDEWDGKLDERVVDYNAALRIAALRLTGELPTLTEMTSIAAAADQKAAYEAQVKLYMAGPKFASQMFHFWQDTLKMGNDPLINDPTQDSAPAFAAQVTVENRPFTDMFTATTGTCPTFNETAGTFTAANCNNGVAQATGLLTHPGVMKQFFSNFGFRRVRWMQEVFACTAFPAETSTVAQDVHGATPYIGVFPYDTAVAGSASGGRVDFKDVSAQVCANCHSNINHIAPLVANFDEQGQYQSTIQVPTPLPMNPKAVLTDYLPAGEKTAWRHGVLAPDLPTLGHDMAADPVTASCVISRMWNWALGKSDIVDGGNRVPLTTTQAVVDAFTSNNYKLKDAIYQIFTSDDFVRF